MIGLINFQVNPKLFGSIQPLEGTTISLMKSGVHIKGKTAYTQCPEFAAFALEPEDFTNPPPFIVGFLLPTSELSSAHCHCLVFSVCLQRFTQGDPVGNFLPVSGPGASSVL